MTFLLCSVGERRRKHGAIAHRGGKISGVKRQTVCKPGSVPPLANQESGDGHSSGTFVAERLARPTRAAAREARPAAPDEDAACRSYLVLLPLGFALPPPLPAARCAL